MRVPGFCPRPASTVQRTQEKGTPCVSQMLEWEEHATQQHWSHGLTHGKRESRFFKSIHDGSKSTNIHAICDAAYQEHVISRNPVASSNQHGSQRLQQLQKYCGK